MNQQNLTLINNQHYAASLNDMLVKWDMIFRRVGKCIERSKQTVTYRFVTGYDKGRIETSLYPINQI